MTHPFKKGKRPPGVDAPGQGHMRLRANRALQTQGRLGVGRYQLRGGPMMKSCSFSAL